MVFQDKLLGKTNFHCLYLPDYQRSFNSSWHSDLSFTI